MEFRILGPLEVHSDSGAVALGGIKPRAVLAVLLLHPNESVHAERLALALWGEDAPASATKTVQVYVSRLRKALGDADALATTPAGYRLRVRAGELDAERFARLVEDGHRALDAGQAEHAGVVLREALALWRGPPLAELAFEPFARADIARLQEQRLAAVEARVEADLAVGRHVALVAELRQLVAANPTRERLAGQLMLALYRSGQQADALETFHAARRVLVEELGVEPGPELRRLQAAILRQDVLLEPQVAVPELPQELDAGSAPPLVGRDGELSWLRERWERARTGHGTLVALTGRRGIGKSRLAVAVAGEAHRLGAVVVYCSGRGPPETARAALSSAGEASRATLLVVDDVDAAGADVLGELGRLARALAGVPVLALALAEDAELLTDLGIGPDGVLALEPVDAEAVRAIALRYAPGRAGEEVPADRLLDTSGGVPRLVHEVAGQWARREASRRVSAVAGRTAAGRAKLRSMESELTGNVVELQTARERAGPGGGDEAPTVCPFKGLASFEVADAPYFFGRERLVAELVARLVGTPLLGVVGPSGSGKSSALRAGLLPALASGVLPGSDGWAQVVIRPGEHPLRECNGAAAGLGGDARWVLAIDQFEETFTACHDEHERAAFIAELTRIARGGDGRGIVLLAIRADHYGHCAAYPELSSLLAPNHVLVGPMRRDELRRAVECPAQRVGLRVEPELADALVADIEDEPGGLPLLSAALLELWQHRDGRRLRYLDYEHTGGVRGAVARLAEDAFTQLDGARQTVARGVLMRLVGLAADGAVERRRVALDDFPTERSEDVAAVLALFTDRRLLTVSTATVEVAHEALLREWPRLGGWIEEDRESMRLQQNLVSAAQEWRRLGHDEEALYRGSRLTEALTWRAADATPQVSALEREFLAASEASGARAHATRLRRIRLTGAAVATLAAAVVAIVVTVLFAGRARDIAASRDLATKSSTLIATDPGLALAIAREALRRRDTEQAQTAMRQATLAHRATRVVAAHDGLVFGVAPSPDGRLAATAGGDRTVRIWSVGSGRRVGEIRGYRAEVRAVSFSRDGRRVASAAHDGEIAVAAAGGGRRDVVAHLKGDHATTIDFGADGTSLAIGTYGGRVALVRLSDGAVRDLGPRAAAPIFAAGFDRDARRVVSAGADGFARIWNVAGGRPLALPHPGQAVLAASFSPDGGRVATADSSGAVRLWDAGSGRALMRIKLSDQPLASVRFSGDGRRIATAATDGVIHLAAVRQGAALAEFKGHDGPARVDFIPGSGALVSAGEEDGTLRTSTPPATRLPMRPGTSPRFSRDGDLVVSGSLQGPVHIWDPATGRDRTLAGHGDESFPRFSPDGTQIVSASHDDSVRLWDVKSGRSRAVASPGGTTHAAAVDATGERIAIGGTTLVIQAPDGSARLRLRQHGGLVNALAFSPDSQHLLSGSDDGAARIWNARSGELQRTLRGHDGIVRSVSYSDDGEWIATAGSDATVRVWPAGGGDTVTLVGHEGPVNTARFNGRGDRLVSAGVDGTIRIWDAAGGDALVVLYRHEGIASGADFSGDGRQVVSAGADGMRITACEVCGTLQDTLRVAQTRAQHELTVAERRRLVPGG